MAEFVAFDQNAEVRGIVLKTFRELSQFGCALSKILDEYGIDLDNPAEWYPIQDWLNVKKQIVDTFGQATIFFIGLNVSTDAIWPPNIDSLEKALFSIDEAYHMNHRGGEIGFYKTVKISDKEYSVTSCTPYPSYFDLGLIRGICNKFTQPEDKVVVALDTSRPTRRSGAECCTYTIRLGGELEAGAAEPWTNDCRLLMHKVLKEAFEVMGNVSRELENANHAKDQFFNIIAHDLKGPTGSIAYLLDTYARHNNELPVDVVHALSEHSNKIYQLVDNLLTWARGQKGLLEVKPQAFDLHEVVQETQGVLLAEAMQKGVNLSPLAGEAISVFSDKVMISTVIRNLMSNAIKYCDNGDHVSVDVAQGNQHVVISIKDTGRGIPAAKLPNLFKAGKDRRSTPGTQGESGTGFGLLLCHEFVEANKGELGVESTEGQGSRFWFTVPIART